MITQHVRCSDGSVRLIRITKVVKFIDDVLFSSFYNSAPQSGIYTQKVVINKDTNHLN